ncbi:MAG: hypothetical protein GF344_15530 [Chitinivibrionales bacterium]|nr:hypothetical protein [Chitinivibrionales bacterium]MBD3358112.1 hypothetical protein [Chitinivibrionales bacterium]
MNINAPGGSGSIDQFLKLAEIARTRNAGFSTPAATPARPARPARPAPALSPGLTAGFRAYGPRNAGGARENEPARHGRIALGKHFDAYA